MFSAVLMAATGLYHIVLYLYLVRLVNDLIKGYYFCVLLLTIARTIRVSRIGEKYQAKAG